MKANREKTMKLMQSYCEGNYNRFARELGLDPSHLHRFITTGVGGGKKLVGAIIRFCKLKKLNFEEYIDIYDVKKGVSNQNGNTGRVI